MPRISLVRFATGLALVIAAVAGGRTDASALAVLAFGLINTVITLPGTRWVTWAAIATAAFALAWPSDRPLLMSILWLAWPSAMLVGWGFGRDDLPRRVAADAAHRRNARLGLAAIVAAVATGVLFYRAVFGSGLGQTAALFVGVPAIMAVVVTFALTPRSALGVAFKAITIGLLVSMIFLTEGILCVLMSAPLFFGVAVAIAALGERLRRPASGRPRVLSCVALLAFVPMSLEGVWPATSFERQTEVSVTRVVRASPEAVAKALQDAPRFDRPLPRFLRAGFPRPVDVRIDHGASPARWVVHLRGGETRLNGQEPRPGDLVLVLDDYAPGRARWRVVSDDSHMRHFLRWQDAIVEWRAATDGGTVVTWTLRYQRDLDPAWYFGPWQHYAAALAAGYLIETVATP